MAFSDLDTQNGGVRGSCAEAAIFGFGIEKRKKVLLTLSTAEAGRFLLLRFSSALCSLPFLGFHLTPLHI